MVAQPYTDGDPSATAPGGLERVRRFMNSLDLYRGRDELAGVNQARRLLRALPDADREVSVGESVLPRIRLARAAMRWSVDCSTLWTLDEDPSTAEVPPDWVTSPRLVLGINGFRPEGQGLHALLSVMTLDLLVAQRTGTITRLKPCANPACQWIFWDASRPGSGRWCSMRLCGGQSKSRRFRARHTATVPE